MQTESAQPPERGINAPLRDVSVRRSLPDDLERIWSRRHFLWYVAVSELRSEQIDTLLGNVWHILNPALQISVYYVVFGLVLETNRGVDNFLPFLAIGIFSFAFMKRTVMQGAKSIVSNQGLIQSISFPLATLPISVVASQLVAYIFPLIVMLGVAVATGEFPMFSWIFVVPIVGLMAMFSLGMAFAAARITYQVRDFQNILDFIFRMLFYFSGVLFLVDKFVPNAAARQLVNLNPFLDFLYLQRWAVMGMDIAPLAVVSGIAWAVFGLVFGYLYFRRREHDYGRE